eukprot:6077194-Alexandrium_andersonii.AAC.1
MRNESRGSSLDPTKCSMRLSASTLASLSRKRTESKACVRMAIMYKPGLLCGLPNIRGSKWK